MSIVLWILQGLLAIHTGMGAVWKFSHSAEQTMPSLRAIPQGAWLAMAIVELLGSACLVVPLVYAPAAMLIPAALAFIAAEMLLFTGLHLYSGSKDRSPLVYWLVVAVWCALIAYGRLVLRPL